MKYLCSPKLSETTCLGGYFLHEPLFLIFLNKSQSALKFKPYYIIRKSLSPLPCSCCLHLSSNAKTEQPWPLLLLFRTVIISLPNLHGSRLIIPCSSIISECYDQGLTVLSTLSRWSVTHLTWPTEDCTWHFLEHLARSQFRGGVTSLDIDAIPLLMRPKCISFSNSY